MKTITLEDGRKISISEEEYNKLAERKPTLEDILKSYYGSNAVWITDEEQNKFASIRDMILVAKHLNGDWDAKNAEKWFELFYNDYDKKIEIGLFRYTKTSFARFKDRDTAELAIEILGEGTIKTALL
jgi:hypothetical protein